ncbi:DNA translocase FtsK [uncultured Parolsenella sp.]|uniref:FtsK/SpoIIIE family DNA translocase n=1 Tax=uncultured Parolsenella sp. TaxID=2083008 RepID=UPI0027DE5BBC|nr:DNA translocase FtsK [uncultured Parolsenella sp.]
MPAKRSQNAKRQVRRPQTPAQAGTANDLVGVAIIVLALSMIVALALPSTAIVTHAMAEGLRLGFGAGAMLVPIALILFACTLFLPTDNPLVGRVALGLGLVVLAALSMLSILAPEAALGADAVLSASVAVVSGGYVGSGVAWLLLTLVGQVVGMVLLVGLAVAGVVVCGFSISNLALKIRRSMGVAAERIQEARERGATRRAGEAGDHLGDEPWDEEGDDAAELVEEPRTRQMSEPKTSFIGNRKTSVLRRGPRQVHEVDHKTATLPLDRASGDAGAVVPPEPATALLSRRRHPELDIKDARPAQELAPEAAPSAGGSSDAADVAAIPDFLLAAAGSRGQAGEDTAGQPEEAPADSGGTVAAASRPAPNGSRSKAQVAPATTRRPGDGSDDFVLPPLSLLKSNPNSASSASSDSELERTARRLQSTLEEFGLTSRVSGWTAGPLVTTFKIEMGEGERVNKITNLQDDIQLSLASESVRIFAPIPGTSLVGIEIPNKTRQNVCLGDVLPCAQGGPLEFAIGRDSEGAPVVADLARMPHMLVAGTTGSGKSVLINAIIMSLVMRTNPEQVRLILVDPKRVEFSCYAGLPHLYVPVVTEPRQAASALQWAVTEMDRRLKVFERAGARDVKVYNRMVEDGRFDDQENPPKPMPYLVIVIDELSDLMMVAGKDVEASIVRIAQLARAAGIHLVLATQRPSADVVTGLIKSNVDTRVALKVSSSIDSRVILDQTGAERLMGRGDMLFRKAGGVLRRVLGAYASDAEIESVVGFIRDQREPEYHAEILSAVVPGQPGAGAGADPAEEDDPLVWEAAQVVVDSQLGSTSGLQRRLKVGYARAGRIMDMLEQKGVVGPPDGSKPREVLLDTDGLEELRQAEEAYREV